MAVSATSESQTYTRLSFEGAFSKLLGVSATLDVGSLIDAAGDTAAIDCTGAALGDMVLGISCSLDLQDITVTGYVSATDVVELRFQNEGAATVDLSSLTVKVLVGTPRF